MAVNTTIALELPSLRRFARSMTGSQRAGDVYVSCMLDRLLLDPGLVSRGHPVKISLFRQLASILASACESTQPTGYRAFELRAHRARQAWLLFAVEQMTVEEIAIVLDLGVSDIRGLLTGVAREVKQQSRAHVVIMEDDGALGLELAAMVERLGHEVAGIAQSSQKALTIIASLQPDLVIAEAHLLQSASKRGDLATTTICMSARPEELLTGLRPEPAFVLTKPFDVLPVEAMISQAQMSTVRTCTARERGTGLAPSALRSSPALRRIMPRLKYAS